MDSLLKDTGGNLNPANWNEAAWMDKCCVTARQSIQAGKEPCTDCSDSILPTFYPIPHMAMRLLIAATSVQSNEKICAYRQNIQEEHDITKTFLHIRFLGQVKELEIKM